jgi:hypothetical protein
MTLALSEQCSNSLDADSATGCFSYTRIIARPKMNTDGATRHNAVGSFIRMNLYESKFGTKELDASLDVQ